MRSRLLLVLVAACSSRSAPPTEAGTHDAAREADAKQTVDSGRDAAKPIVDAPGDAGKALDTGAPADAGVDARIIDAGRDVAAFRDPLVQPFATSSIWNTPIGSGASYVAANIGPRQSNALQADEDIIVMSPTSPVTAIYKNNAGWSATLSRCPIDSGILLENVPMPASLVISDTPTSDTANSGLAALMPDRRTVKQTQPFARCTAGQPGTSLVNSPDVDLYGDGIPGAHGGSGLSAIGGTLRVGELRPGGPPPHHVLKLELFAKQNYYNDGNHADCFVWPATNCDGYWNDGTSSLKYGGTNPALRPGSLVAIPASVSLASLGLTTEPANQLAWTLQNYGAYLVDDTAYSSVNICVERGPAGSFDQQFQTDYGFAVTTGGLTGAFAKDMLAIESALFVVANNGPTSTGGGGTPLQPLALPLPPEPGG